MGPQQQRSECPVWTTSRLSDSTSVGSGSDSTCVGRGLGGAGAERRLMCLDWAVSSARGVV